MVTPNQAWLSAGVGRHCVLSLFNQELPSAHVITGKIMNKDRTPAGFIGIGLAIGAGVGVATGNIAVGVGVGLAIGAALAAATRKKLQSQLEEKKHHAEGE